MEKMKRLLSLLLALVMVLGVLPASIIGDALSALAATTEETIYVIAGSDYQGTGDDWEKNTGTARGVTTTKILNELASCGIKPYGVFLGGDYTRFQTFDGSVNMSKEGINQLKDMTTSILGVKESAVKWAVVQGNHDRQATTADGLSKAGNNDTEHYGVWVLHNNDYGWTTGGNMAGDTELIEKERQEMKAYFDAKIKEGYTKPIFIVAHTPLHYSYRTREYEDARYGRMFFNVINEAGAKGLNIIYLFGHNHSGASDSYLGGGAVYLSRGDTIFVSKTGDVSATPSKLTLNFTYMNYGYLSYAGNQNSNGNTASMAVFAITGDKVEIKRYCYYGLLNLKLAGKAGDFGTDGKEDYGTYGISPSEWDAYLAKSVKSTVIEPIAQTNIGDTVTIPKYGTRYYRVNGFKEGQFFVISNFGETTATGKKILGSYTDAGNVRETTADIQHDDRGYYITMPSGVTAKEFEWVWEGYAQSENGTVGSLKNRANNRYLQMTETATGYFSLEAKGLTTTEGRPTDEDYKMFWGYDNKTRTEGNHAGKASGIYVHSSKELNVLANRYYMLRAAGKNAWAARGNTGPTGDCGPTYIYKRFTDVHTGDNKYKVTGADSELFLITGQYSSWERLKTKLLSTLKVTVNGKQTTDFTLTSDFVSDEVGNYVAYVNCQGHTIGTIKIHVADAKESFNAGARKVELVPNYGFANKDAAGDTATGSMLRLYFNNGAQVDVPITVGMLRDADGNKVSTATLGTQEDLSVWYYYNEEVGDYTIKVPDFTLYVVDENYPIYPNPGSVRVNKVGTGIDFQNTGAAKVELSATSVPKVGGFDVIVMVDTSSSMGVYDGQTETRLERTHNAVNLLIDTLKENVSEGKIADVQIAIADFNDYRQISTPADYTNKPWGYYAMAPEHYIYDESNTVGLPDKMKDWTEHGTRTGTDDPLDMSAKAFVDVMQLNNNGQKWASNATLDKYSGTNYDFAFDAIYQLGYNIKKRNEDQGKGDRELIVVFMSDGSPFQFNYFQGNSDDEHWNRWISKDGFESTAQLQEALHGTGVDHFYNPAGQPWMAHAIKGSPDKRYNVIRKSTAGLTDIKATGKKNQYSVPGLGAKLYTIGLSLGETTGANGITETNKIFNSTVHALMKRIASDPSMYYPAVKQDELDTAFSAFVADMKQGATESYFLDTIGDDYDLYMSNKIAKSDGTTVSDVTPQIQALRYNLVDGVRVGNPHVRETITFGGNYLTAAVGDTVTATSSEKGDISFTMGGLMNGKYIIYNSSKTDSATITYYNQEITLAPETFIYKIGTLKENYEYAVSYHVYLTDALDDNKDNVGVPAGIYPTNESAVLHYKNYLGVKCQKDTVSPQMPWKSAQVSYGFYLVDENGDIIRSEETGQTTEDFNSRVEITPPVVFDSIDLNTTSDVLNSILSSAVLPEGYELFVYDEATKTGVTYTVTVNSGTGGGEWTITGDNTGTTYVTGHNGDAYSNATSNNASTDAFNNTTVWFAVVAKVKAVPDVIVVDFGLPVELDVMENDIMIGTKSVLSGIGVNAPTNMRPVDGSNATLQSGFAKTLARKSTGLKYGTAKIQNGKVLYTLDKANSMQMKDAEVFYYGLQYSGTVGAKGFYYSTVTVIPATTIYYEDSFVTFNTYDASTMEKTTDIAWKTAGTTDSSAAQDQDRPGDYIFNDLDADNIYGYDGAYSAYGTYSNGSAKYVDVKEGYFAEAVFTFWGTGFDVISTCYRNTGAISVDIFDADVYEKNGYVEQNIMKSFMVDTYWGYAYGDHDSNPDTPDEWYVPEGGSSYALYQVPVIKVKDLPYDRYTVVITAAYSPAFDHYNDQDNNNSYRFYLDAIRIYDPANDGADNKVIENAYTADKEGWPDYFELRDKLIDANTFNKINESGVTEGIVFIDGMSKVGTDSDPNAPKPEGNTTMKPQVATYMNYGPNNELYLAKGQAVTFQLNVTNSDNVAAIHLAVKSIRSSKTVTVKVWDVNADSKDTAEARTIKTDTDMYYDITDMCNKNVIIYNASSSDYILSITNIKVTYKTNPNGTSGQSEDTTEVEYDMEELLNDPDSNVKFTVSRESVEQALRSLTVHTQNNDTEDNKPEDTKPEDTKPEDTETEDNKPEDNETEDNKPEDNETEDNKPEDTETEDNKPEDTETEDNKPEDTETEDNKPEDNETEDNKPEDNETEDNKPEDNDTEDNKPEASEPEETQPATTEPAPTVPEKPEGKGPDALIWVILGAAVVAAIALVLFRKSKKRGE